MKHEDRRREAGKMFIDIAILLLLVLLVVFSLKGCLSLLQLRFSLLP